MSLVPLCLWSRTSRGERSYDIFSRLLNDRIVMLTEEVNDTTASLVVAQLLYLEGQDPTKDISLYINSPGGSVWRVCPSMIPCSISSATFLPFASEWPPAWEPFLLAMAQGQAHGSAQQRYYDPSAQRRRQGQATDILIHANHIARTKKNNEILAERTGQPLEVIERDTEAG